MVANTPLQTPGSHCNLKTRVATMLDLPRLWQAPGREELRVCLGFPLLAQEVDSGSSHVSRPALQVRRCCHVPCSGYQGSAVYVEDEGTRGPGEGLNHAVLPLGREPGQSKEAGQESSHLSGMGRNSVLRRQETKVTSHNCHLSFLLTHRSP